MQQSRMQIEIFRWASRQIETRAGIGSAVELSL
jgi:hypothetical protein